MTDLGAELAAALEGAVRETVGDLGPDTVLLVSEIGRPVTFESAGLQPVALRQRTSDFVDCLPQPAAGAFVPELDPFSARYETLLGTAVRRPGLPEDVGAGVDRLIAGARQRFEESRAVRIDQPTSFWETAQEPADWYVSAGPHWQTMIVGDGVSTTPVPPRRYPYHYKRWGWRVPIHRPETERTWARLGVDAGAAGPGPRVEPARLRPPAKNGPATAAATLVAARPARPARPDTDAARATLAEPAAARAVIEASEAVAVTSAGFRIEMSYAVVTLRRSWLDTTWWSNPYWYAPGTADGAWSAGDVTIADQLLAAVPAALVVVKDVKITASWAGADAARLAALPPTLGPFALAGGTVINGTLQISGIQTIAWLCKVPPRMPPPPPAMPAEGSDPVTVSLPRLARGSVGPQVRVLQGLLMAAGRFAPDPALMTGRFGPKTDAAVRNLQADRSIATDIRGTVDHETWSALLTPDQTS